MDKVFCMNIECPKAHEEIEPSQAKMKDGWLACPQCEGVLGSMKEDNEEVE